MSQKVQVILEVTSRGMDAFGKVSGTLDRFQNKVTSVFNSIVNLPNIVAGTLGTGLMASFVKADMQLEAMENRMSAAVGKFTDSAEEMKYVRAEADRMGLKFVDLASSYSGFAAATTRAGISMEETRRIFKDISETAVSLKLSPERVKLTFMALEQMASKGVVSMEELRRQLGDSFPAAMEIGAKAMNMGTQEFNKLVASGNLLSADFLPRFATQVKTELGGSFETSAHQLQANLGRITNAWFDLKQSVGDVISAVVNEMLPSLMERMQKLKDDIILHKDDIAMALNKVPYYFDKILESITALAKFVYDYKDAIFLIGISFAFAKAVVAVNSLRIAFISLGLALYTNPILAVAAALVGLGVVAQQTQGWTKKYAENAALQDKAKEIANLQELLSVYEQRIDDVRESTDAYTGAVKQTLIPNQKLDAEIKILEGRLSEFGISIEGGLIEKAGKAMDKLDELTGKVRATGEAAKSFQEIIPVAPKSGTKQSRLKDERDKIKTQKERTEQFDANAAWHDLVIRGSEVTAEIAEKEKEMQDTAVSAWLEASRKGQDAAYDVAIAHETSAERMKKIWEDVKESIENSMKGAFMTMVSIEGTMKEKLLSILNNFYQTAMGFLWDYLAEYIKAKMTESAIGSAQSTKTNAENISNAATGGVKTAIDAGGSVAKIPYVGAILAAAAISSILAIVYSQISKAKGYAAGTNYAAPGLAWVGENGRELMQMKGGERILSNRDSMRAISGGNMTVNLTINGNTDKSTVNYAVNRLKQFRDDYNNAIRYRYLNPALAR
ncbi:tape measure protein [Sulfuricurvum sp.]|uniref:tape measure protein n=1 Tax=Sulfuricurvum sp. TaxID=2025608 RepID=UPI00356465F7